VFYVLLMILGVEVIEWLFQWGSVDAGFQRGLGIGVMGWFL
jgi:hypothetical protein